MAETTRHNILNPGQGLRFGTHTESQLLYISRASPEFRDLVAADPSALQTLGEQASRNNGSLGITGLLLYNAGNFMQLLEGDAFVIMDLFHAITRDQRHTQIERLAFGNAESRLFREWNMGVLNLDHNTEFNRKQFQSVPRARAGGDEAFPIKEATRRLLVEFRHSLRSTAP